MNRTELRDQAALSALQGFCANPSVFAPSPMSGWYLVNCTQEQLAYTCWEMADAFLNMLDAESCPESKGEG